MVWTLGWLAAALALLLVSERWIHRHLQGLALLVTRDPQSAVVLYALPLLPGIILHETSHALAGILLGVRVGRISIRPRLARGRIQLGFVPVERTDFVRASLIGLAPLLVGTLAIWLIGRFVFGLEGLGQALAGGEPALLWHRVVALARAPDAWLWAYLIFTVSNTMLPSRSDRQAWVPLLLFLLVGAILVGAGATLSGHGALLARRLEAPLTAALRWLAIACTFTVAADLPFIALVGLLERLVSRLSGVRVEY